MQEVEIINLENVQVVSLPKKKTKTEISTTSSKIIAGIVNKWWFGTCYQQSSKSGTLNTPATVDFIKMTTEAKERRKIRHRAQK